jgi:hypothetical protein
MCIFIFKKIAAMEEIIFLVEESEDGGYIAKGLGVSIYTEADTIEELRIAVKDAVSCHFDDSKRRIIRLHIVRDEIIAA